MAKIAIYNLKGEATSEESIPAVFGSKENPRLMTQAINTQLSNSRKITAHTKMRGEVSGGGRKPWKQKGTGRARAGSSRSPLWIGGGITFGPRSIRNYHKRINQKMAKIALNLAITEKIKEKRLILTENMEIEKISTKSMYQFFEKLPIKEGKILVVIEKISPNLELSLANIPYVKVIKVQNINLLDLLNHDYIVMEKTAFDGYQQKPVQKEKTK